MNRDRKNNMEVQLLAYGPCWYSPASYLIRRVMAAKGSSEISVFLLHVEMRQPPELFHEIGRSRATFGAASDQRADPPVETPTRSGSPRPRQI
jgi:hypothetical protein